MRRATAICVAVAAGMLADGCAGRAKVGRGSFEVLGTAEPIAAARPDNAGKAQETGERIDYVPVHARGPLAHPEYPAAALAGEAGDWVLYVTFTVDERGRVTEVGPSWNRIQTAGKFQDAFLAAAKTALEEWALEPACEVYWKRRPGGDDEYLRTETVAERLEVKFVFEARAPVR